MNETKMIEVKATITMSRSLYIEVPAESTNEEIISKAKTEILIPQVALETANAALRKVGIVINGLDLKDWETNNIEFTINE